VETSRAVINITNTPPVARSTDGDEHIYRKMGTQTHDKATTALIQAVTHLLRPLIRLLIAHGIAYPQMRELLKGLYVDVATQELGRDGATPTDSRLFLMTGVHRKDIRRLREEVRDSDVPGAASLGGAVLGCWLGDPAWQDADGRPRCLPRKGDADGPGFDELVGRVSKDVRPRTILDEWLRLGIVEMDDRQRICLRREAFVPDGDFVEQSFFLARNVHDHLAACVHNMEEQAPPFLERSVYYSDLSHASVDELRKLAENEGMAVLHRINQRALELKKRDAGAGDKNWRMRFGSYWFQCREDDGQEEDS